MSDYINTELLSNRLREAAINLKEKSLLITNFHETEQAHDFTEPPNCEGLGRIRHFQRNTGTGWPPNPLPIDPACKILNLPRIDVLRAQVFQNAVCNWRCWYCFVPYNLLAANLKYSNWVKPNHLIDLYLQQPDPPSIIDLSGGQPDLVPEWLPWMIIELQNHGIDQKVYLWSDDNLSNDYFWRFLSNKDRDLIASYTHYGRACCFKGFNAESFSFNTKASPDLFDRQFELMGKLLTLGIDVYAYVTFTTPSSVRIIEDVRRFVDRLQGLDKNLPLRTVPLEVQVFSPVKSRMNDSLAVALKNQYKVIEAWKNELDSRFSQVEQEQNIAFVQLSSHGG